MNYVLVMPQPRGQITLPKKFRSKYGIKPGVPVKISDADGGIRVDPVRVVSYPVRQYTDEEVEEFLKLDAKETKRIKGSI